ncbi:hypothetical protein Q4I30_000459, partial [Leishmania utingensis]
MRRPTSLRALVRAASVALTLALLVPAASGAVGAAVAAMTVTTTPLLPLLDVPFHADVTGIGRGHRLFLSRRSDCSGASGVTSVCTLGSVVEGGSFVNGTCVFTVTSEALGVDLTSPRPTVPAVHWCSSAHPGASVGTLLLNVMITSPLYFYRMEDNELTFSDATPLGSVIGWSLVPECGIPLPNHEDKTLTSDRVVSLKYRGAVVYVCAAVPTVSGTMTAMALRTTLTGAYRYTISPTSGVRHRTIIIASTQPLSQYYLSRSALCIDADPPFQDKVGSLNPFIIIANAGTYYFCAATTPGKSAVYVPSSNSFTVEEYDVQPHTMYASLETPLTYGLDATGREEQLELALSTTADCMGGSLAIPWGASMSWAVPKGGAYYACVRDRGEASTAGCVGAIAVTDAPALTFSP